MQDAFPHMPVGVAQKTDGLRGKLVGATPSDQETTTLEHSLTDEHLAVGELLDEGPRQVREVLVQLGELEDQKLACDVDGS